MASSAYSTFFVRLSKGILALSLLGFGSCQRELLTVNDLDLTLRPSVSVQTTVRLAAGLALNFGTSSANMLPQPVTTANGDLTLGLPANLDRLNANIGLHWMLYEKSYRKNAKARRVEKNEKCTEKKKKQEVKN